MQYMSSSSDENDPNTGLLGQTRSSSSSSSDDGSDGSETFKVFTQKFSEEEIATILIIIGFVLFFIPPFTVLGVILIIIGAITWLSDWLWG